jgi:hypothetical protein
MICVICLREIICVGASKIGRTEDFFILMLISMTDDVFCSVMMKRIE